VTAESAQKSVENAFDAVGEGGFFKVLTRDDRGRLQYLDTIHSGDIAAGNVEESLKDMYGGGRFSLIPVSGDGKKVASGFDVSILGDSKIKSKRKNDENGTAIRSTSASKELEEIRQQLKAMQEKEREDRLIEKLSAKLDEIKEAVRDGGGRKDIVDSVLANLPQVVTGLGGLRAKQESAADLLEKLSATVRNLENSRPAFDPVSQVTQLSDVIFTIAERAGASRPPVTVGGQGSGFGSSFIRTLIDELERRFSRASLASPQQTPGQPLQQAGSGFAGLAQPATEPTTQTMITLESLGINPIAQLFEMLSKQEDPERVAALAVYIADMLLNFSDPASKVFAYAQQFLWNPGRWFDEAVNKYLPGLRADAEYTSRLREALIKEIDRYNEREEPQEPGSAGTEGQPKPQTEHNDIEGNDQKAEEEIPA